MPINSSDNADHSPWSTPETVAGFARSPPNQRLLRFADERRSRRARDIPCRIDAVIYDTGPAAT